jgi:hypothetical protein
MEYQKIISFLFNYSRQVNKILFDITLQPFNYGSQKSARESYTELVSNIQKGLLNATEDLVAASTGNCSYLTCTTFTITELLYNLDLDTLPGRNSVQVSHVTIDLAFFVENKTARFEPQLNITEQYKNHDDFDEDEDIEESESESDSLSETDDVLGDWHIVNDDIVEDWCLLENSVYFPQAGYFHLDIQV